LGGERERDGVRMEAEVVAMGGRWGWA